MSLFALLTIELDRVKECCACAEKWVVVAIVAGHSLKNYAYKCWAIESTEVMRERESKIKREMDIYVHYP